MNFKKLLNSVDVGCMLHKGGTYLGHCCCLYWERLSLPDIFSAISY